MLISLTIAVLVPSLVAWRVRRFEWRIPIKDVVQVVVNIGEVEFDVRRAVEVNSDGPAQGGRFVEVFEKVLFSPFRANHVAGLGNALKSLGVSVHERGETAQAEFLERLAGATPRAWVTPVLFGMNLLVFVLMCVSDNQAILKPSINMLLRWGADFGPLTVTGQQWWRLLTSCFVHVGLWHLLFNMLALWQAGRIVEKLLGNWFFLALYLGCGLMGSLTSLYFQPHLVSAGASGAIFGIYGALLGFIARQREALPRGLSSNFIKFGLTFVLFNVYASIGSALSVATDPAHGPHIDLACHAGGLMAGLIFGFAAARPLEPEAKGVATTQRSISFAGSLLVLAALLFFPVFKSGRRDVNNYQQLGGMYHNGEGVVRDPAASVHWFQNAAERGDLASQKALGSMYYRGDGVEKNVSEAVRWFTRAGEQSDLDAEKFLAGVYFSGQGVATNNAEGVKWLTKLVDQGADQNFNDLEKALAFAYCSGDGMPQSRTEAVKWLTKVANRGDRDAKAKLQALMVK
jgi:rhomboid protease GluP